ncbi:MAG: DNA/RNA non-specific endonuclease [Bacteroidota bacterium]
MWKLVVLSFLFCLTSGSFAGHEPAAVPGWNEAALTRETAGHSCLPGCQGTHTATIFHPGLPKAGQHDQVITHKGYTLSFNPVYHIANWVAYELTKWETVPSVKRNNHFVPDPLMPPGSLSNADYQGSGYDRGHLAPAADMCYSRQTMQESFYLSNISPQEPGFNRGIWARLETLVRQWACEDGAVYVVTGTVLSRGLPTIGRDRIAVPRYFYKVILDYSGPGIKGIGFIIANEGSQQPLQHYAVTIDSVEKVTGTDFFYQLPDDQQRMVESTIDLSKWRWKATGTGGSQVKN